MRSLREGVIRGKGLRVGTRGVSRVRSLREGVIRGKGRRDGTRSVCTMRGLREVDKGVCRAVSDGVEKEESSYIFFRSLMNIKFNNS